MIRWKQRVDNPNMMNLEMFVDGVWSLVPMVDSNDRPLTEHPIKTKRDDEKRVKKLKKLVEEMKQKKAQPSLG